MLTEQEIHGRLMKLINRRKQVKQRKRITVFAFHTVANTRDYPLHYIDNNISHTVRVEG